MCGIFGCSLPEETQESLNSSVDTCLEALSLLEYRGYDSSGIAGVIDGKIKSCKRAGNVHFLKSVITEEKLRLDTAIAHTRWATHGIPSEENAHPHFDHKRTLALVHNGIIENHAAIRSQLEMAGIVFRSDTDSEVIAQLISHLYKGDLCLTVKKALERLQGSLAIAIIHVNHPDQIVATSRKSPLVIGIDRKKLGYYVCSDAHALTSKSVEVFYLKDDEIAILSRKEFKVYDPQGSEVSKQIEPLAIKSDKISKEGYEHFMLKEIFEQPRAIKRAMQGRTDRELGTALFEDLMLDEKELLAIDHILIVGCGTSWHAGCIAASFLESIARIPTKVEIASEFQYTDPVISKNTLVIAISQSGETADTIAAIRTAKEKGAHVLGICNVDHSTIFRKSDSCLFLNAGPEISVCSTKAFTSQLTVLALFTLLMARLRHYLSKEEGLSFLKELNLLPSTVSQVLSRFAMIEKFAKKYAHYEHFFFLGRRYMFQTSLEAALKLKEISYLNAVGYPSGEMKHGPLALVNPDLAVVGMCGNMQTIDKMLSNLMEVKSRGGNILAFAPRGIKELEKITSDIFYLPKVSDIFASIPYSVAAQLFAYTIAKIRGTEIDKPRNLAKSVTVE